MHWHAYTWTGHGAELKREAERRPDSPDFATSPLPPVRTGDWLAKPPTRIAETFDDATKAVAWMAGEYRPLRPQCDIIPVEHRLAVATDLLPRGWMCSGANGCMVAASSPSAWCAARTGTWPIPVPSVVDRATASRPWGGAQRCAPAEAGLRPGSARGRQTPRPGAWGEAEGLSPRNTA